MSKSNDTTKTRELTEAELAAVSGGYTLENCMISGFVVAGGGGTGSGSGSGSGSAGWDLRQNKA
jgi:bacteriocin-like protein